MIDHYAIFETNNLTDRFALTDGVPKGVKPRYNVSPTQAAPVIVKNDNATKIQMMHWGLVSQGAKDMNSVFRYKTFNVKSEKVFAKPSWSEAVRQQRCLIPVNGFYMIRNDNDDAYYFTSNDQSLFGLAGFYMTWTDPSGVEQHTYGLLTIESNETMPLPFSRMPVIVHKDDEARWIDDSVQDFSAIVQCMRPYEGEILHYKKVSSDIKSTKIDEPALITKLDK